ncbi:MAG: menaquinone biosynthesis protein [Acidobacteriota bacterium]|nr:MAG: menaquinone biosynthesis protein [Acidobacteriota bacterium]
MKTQEKKNAVSNLVSLVRVRSVGYLNAAPLEWGLERKTGEGIIVKRESPAGCLAALREERADVGLVPSAGYEGRWRAVPDVAIASDGAAESVLLAGRAEAPDMKRVALDTASRTAAALVKVLFRERWGSEPDYVEAPAEGAVEDETFDGVLVIGDPALHLPLREGGSPVEGSGGNSPFPHVYDLGAEWKALTGLPFVFAFWAGREDLPVHVVRLLQKAKEEGRGHLRELAERYARTHSRGADFYEHYLRDAIRYDWTPRETEGLAAFWRLAEKHEVIPKAPRLSFYE